MIAFELFYNQLINKIEEKLRKVNLNIFTIEKSLKNCIVSDFTRISLRIFIVEMKLCDKCGELKGKDSKEKYHYFEENYLLSEEKMMEIYAIYPGLHKAMNIAENQWIEVINESVSCYSRDKDIINKEFFADNPATDVIEIGGGSSDSHKNGHRVLWLMLNNGKRIVYKPRNLGTDIWFGELISWISYNIGTEYNWNKMVSNDNYGWCEWVSYKECHTVDELKRYFRKLGILIAATYILDTSDIHYENLISSGDTPIIVDVEVLVGQSAENYKDISVLNSGILPVSVDNNCARSVSIGAINGNGGKTSFKMPQVVNIGSVDMHIEYHEVKMETSQNRASMNNMFVEPSIYVQDVISGFFEVCTYILNNKEVMKNKMKGLNQLPIRYLINHSQIYSMLLNATFFPEVLMSEEQKKKVLDNLPKTKREDKYGFIRECELAELEKGDIPYFWFFFDDTSLNNNTGIKISNYFKISAKQFFESRLDALSDKDIDKQMHLIEAVLRIKENSYVCNSFLDDSINEEYNKNCSLAIEIADIICDDAEFLDDKVTWKQLKLWGKKKTHISYGEMNFWLYEGIAGIAVFLSAMNNISANVKYERIIDVLTEMLIKHTEKQYVMDTMGFSVGGALVGEGSIAYTYQLLFKLTEKEIYRDLMEKQCELIAGYVESNKCFDLLGGSAGIVAIMINAYSITSNIKYILYAEKVAKHILDNKKVYEYGCAWKSDVIDKCLTGVSHGTIGIMWSLLRLYKITEKKEYYLTAYEAFKYEMNFYSSNIHDWIDLRKVIATNEVQKVSAAWCYGREGSRFILKEAQGLVDELWKKEIDEILLDMGNNHGVKHEYCLCHGNFGNAIMNSIPMLYNQSIKKISKNGILSELGIREKYNYGLMNGLCGVGLACLGEVEFVKKILLLTV